MAKIRKAVSYRRLERPYTRKSKYRKLSFVRASPHSKIVRFEMGEIGKKFSHTFKLISKADIQIRHDALESARQTSNRLLEKEIGKTGYFMKIRVFPHHILRENPLAAGAGADRMSTGMQRSFGKPIGIAARVKKGQILIQLDVSKEYLETAKHALKRASYKFPCKCSIEVVENK